MTNGLLSLTACVGGPLLGGAISSQLVVKSILSWYRKIKKPKWTPPDFVFAPMWTLLYITSGLAGWLTLRQNAAKKAIPFGLWVAQAVLNVAWQPLFFGAHRPDLACADSAALLGVATAATVSMSKAAGAKKIVPLMAPYLVWVAYATALSYDIMKKNPDADKIKNDDTATIAKGAVDKAGQAVSKAADAVAGKK